MVIIEFFTLKRAKDKSLAADQVRGVQMRESALVRNQL
jgi:hypothetical protein